MSSGILISSDDSFAITLPFQVFDLTIDTLISPEANDDTEDLNNVDSYATSKADLFSTALMMW